MRRLDPRIHHFWKTDCRVERGNDYGDVTQRTQSALNASRPLMIRKHPADGQRNPWSIIPPAICRFFRRPFGRNSVGQSLCLELLHMTHQQSHFLHCTTNPLPAYDAGILPSGGEN
jgi:hypothetical protein